MIYLCFTFFCKAWCVSIWRIGHCYIDIIRFDLQFTKKEVLLLTVFTFLSQFCSFLFNSCLLYFFRLFVVLNHPHTQHLQDSELCQIRKKTQIFFFFKEMVVLLCLVKTFKNSTKIYHQSEDRLCSSIALQARTLLSWPTQSTALNGTG